MFYFQTEVLKFPADFLEDMYYVGYLAAFIGAWVQRVGGVAWRTRTTWGIWQPLLVLGCSVCVGGAWRTCTTWGTWQPLLVRVVLRGGTWQLLLVCGCSVGGGGLGWAGQGGRGQAGLASEGQ